MSKKYLKNGRALGVLEWNVCLVSLVPQPTCCWKWVGGTKGSKRAFFSLTAVFSAKNGRKLKNGLFLESAVREFSENGFGSEKN